MVPEIIVSDSGWPYSKAKTAVLLAAASVICAQGPRAATLKNIAGRAGITEPAIFRHFDGVDGLFNGLFTAYERISDRFDQAFESEESGLAHLREAMNRVVDILASSGDLAYTVLHAELIFRGYPDLLRRVAELKRGEERMTLDCIVKAVAAGDIRADLDPDTILAASLGLMYYTTATWIESGFDFDLREVFEARWEDAERFIAVKPMARSAKQVARLRSAALRVESPASDKGSARASKSARAVGKGEGPAKKATASKVPAKASLKAERPRAKVAALKTKKK